MKRREFPAKVRVAAFERCKGRCEECTAKLMTGHIHYDHRVPDALGGEPTLENCQVLCRACHGLKTTNEDVPRIVKSRHQHRGHIGAKQRKGPPLPGGRDSGWKHTINHGWVRR